MATQFGRSLSVLAHGATSVVDLASLRIKFEISKSETQSPNTAEVTVYNLSRERSAKLGSEYASIAVNAGYTESNGLIYSGDIIKIQRGREGNTETYAKLTLADGDKAYNRTLISTTLRAGSGKTAQRDTTLKELHAKGAIKTIARLPAVPNDISRSRGRVLFGPAREVLRNAAHNSGAAWSVQDGEILWLPAAGDCRAHGYPLADDGYHRSARGSRPRSGR